MMKTTSPWLVVLDDLADPADLTGLWPPVTPSGRTVVTTRRRDASLASHGTLIEVGLFSPAESLAYLTGKFAKRPDRLGRDRKEAAALANDLGHLPLALGQAAAFIADRDITCAQYRQRLGEAQYLVEVVPRSGENPDDYPLPMAGSLLLSLDAADQLLPAGLARPLLVLLSLLDPNGIPTIIVTTRAVLDYLSISRTAASDGASVRDPVAELQARDALACLARLSLIDLNSASTNDATYPLVLVHAMVQRATRDSASADLTAHAARAAADGLVQAWPDVEREPQLGQALRANADALRQWAEVHLWNSGAHAVLFRRGRSAGEAGLVALAAGFFERLVIDSMQRLGADHHHTLAARGGLALWRGQAGNTSAAIAELEALLADDLRVLGRDHPDTLVTRANLASLRRAAGDAIGAVAALETLLADRLRVLGADHPDTLSTRANLATWQGQLGDVSGAVTALKTLLADRLRVLGADHPDTLLTRANLATWQGQLEPRYAGHAAVALRAVQIDYVRVLGPDHPDTLAVRGSLAFWMGRARDVAGAVAAFEALLVDCLRVLGPDHLDTLSTRTNLASWRGQLGYPRQAAEALNELRLDYVRILGPDHPETLAVRGSVAFWQGKAGDPAGAAAAFQELLADHQRVLGVDHPITQSTHHNLERWRSRSNR
jgi:hypothetical protein